MKEKIVLEMDRDAAEFYIDLLSEYASKHDDAGVGDDVKDLRRQYDWLWPDDEEDL